MSDRYVITRLAGVDTAHCNPREECNLDDTDADRTVSEDEAFKALSDGSAAACRHCWADAEIPDAS